LTGAELRLKAGTHYGLLGRNGTGKSTLLRAMAQQLIPGLSRDTRISILQQTATEGVPSESGGIKIPTSSSGKTVLQQVVESDVSRNIVLQDLKGYSYLFRSNFN